MAATVIIERLTSTGPTETDITSINTRANAEDAHSTAGTSNAIQKPAAGTNYSYWVSTRLKCTVTPSSIINNIRWYTDGSNGMGTGITCKVALATAYAQATGTPGVSGTQLTEGNHGSLTGAPADAFGYTSGSPLSVTGSISNPSTGLFGYLVVYQVEVASTASPGATNAETFTWKYDEI